MTNTPNILFIVLDSARARNTSLLGYHRDTTPNLEAMDGTTFTNARAPSTWSLPSHASMFTGLEAHEHGLSEPKDTIDTEKTLATKLSNEGYQTAAFTDNVFVSMIDNGIKEGFDYLGEQNETAFFDKGLSPNGFVVRYGNENRYQNYIKQALTHDYPLRSVLNGVLWKFRYTSLGEKLEMDRDNGAEHHSQQFLNWAIEQNQPWFSFLNFMDTHEPYSPEKQYSNWEDDKLTQLKQQDKTASEYYATQEHWWIRKAIENLYDGTIRQADAAIGWIIEQLKAEDMYDNTLIIVTADHGECFVDQSELVPNESLISHRHGIVEELLHVPLKIKYPNQTDQTVETQLTPLTNLFNLAYTFATTNDKPDITAQSAQMMTDGNRHDSLGQISPELTQPLFAEYKQETTGTIQKTIANKNIIKEFEVFSPTAKQEQDSTTTIEEFHEKFEPLSKELEEQAELSDGVEDKLEDLGYM